LGNLVVVMEVLVMMSAMRFASAVVCRECRFAAAVAAPGPVGRIQCT
jgi:hypothetical protein